MHALNRNLIALALGAVLVSPAAFAQQDKSKTGQTTTSAGQPTADSVTTGQRPASPTLPTQANPTASDAISERTDAAESGDITDTTATSTTGNASANAGGTTLRGTAAAAQDSMASSNPGKGNWWKDADTDGDGKLSSTEANANAGLSSRFATIDSDKDGFVTPEEYRTFYAANASQGEQNAAAHSAVVTRDVWVKLDADADSRISLAEAAANADLNASFSMMDSNSDGFVTQAEYQAYSKTHK
jgi:EF hand